MRVRVSTPSPRALLATRREFPTLFLNAIKDTRLTATSASPQPSEPVTAGASGLVGSVFTAAVAGVVAYAFA